MMRNSSVGKSYFLALLATADVTAFVARGLIVTTAAQTATAQPAEGNTGAATRA
jgi:hypothetical protein